MLLTYISKTKTNTSYKKNKIQKHIQKVVLKALKNYKKQTPENSAQKKKRVCS